MSRILVIDNYDSFVFNLVQYLAQIGAEVTVRRNDEVTPAEVLDFDGYEECWNCGNTDPDYEIPEDEV